MMTLRSATRLVDRRSSVDLLAFRLVGGPGKLAFLAGLVLHGRSRYRIEVCRRVQTVRVGRRPRDVPRTSMDHVDEALDAAGAR